MKLNRIVILCVLLFAPTTLAQEEPKSEQVASVRPLKIADARKWERVSSFTLSPDGKWQGHVLQPNEGDGKLIVSQLANESSGETSGEETKESKAKRYEYVVGPGSGRITFSHDAKYAAYIEAPKDKAAKAARKSKKPIKNKLVLLDLASGEKTEFESAQNYAFSGENPKCLAIQKMKPTGRPSGDAGWEGTDLLIYDLAAKTQINLGNVRAFQFNEAGDHIALTIDAEGKSGNGIQLFNVNQSSMVTLDNDKAQYRSLRWNKEGDAIVALKSTKDDDYENPHHRLIAFSNVTANERKRIDIDPKSVSVIPEDMTISPNRQPNWTEDGSAILFGIHDMKKKKDAKPKEEEDGDKEKASTQEPSADELAGLVIWHWKDERMQSMQQKQESRDKNRFDLCIYRVDDDTTFRLGDDEIPDVSASEPFRYAVGSDNRPYELDGNLHGQRYRDIYVIDLKTGQRKLALEKARYFFGTSPVSDHCLYYQDGHFHVYNMANGQSTNITQKVKTSFVDDENDVNVEKPPRGFIGWSADGKQVLLNDGWDIWSVPISAGGGKNLTVNGKKDGIRYRQRFRMDPDEKGIDLSIPQYVSIYGEWTKQAGVGRITGGKPGVEVLLMDDATFFSVVKLKDQDVYYYMRSSHSDPTDMFVGGPDLKDAQQVTHSNKQQKDFEWSSGVRLIDYKSDHGDKLQAALFLPAGHIEGKKYPTVVYIYEKLSQRANSYDSPRHGGFSTSIYTSNGYAVLMPDIVYKINDPGLSAQACVIPALQAAIDSGVVDKDRVGLHGHSWGGYQTAFLITQSDAFAAAVAGAPLTNLISMYSSVYWNSGSANQPIFESSQGRFTGGYWTNIEAYTRNSPVYFAEKVNTPLLLLHNDQDGAVDWNQGIEYFNTLRRLEKPVVMLQYVGENHGLRKDPNREDYSYRMMAFFDHYLKDKDAPDWWAEGIKHLDMKQHIKDHKKANDGK